MLGSVLGPTGVGIGGSWVGNRALALGRYQGVTAFIGMPGSGKTYGLAEVAARGLKAGKPVFCNEGFDVVGAERFAGFDEFLAIPNGSVVVWDELPIFVNSRKWQEFPDGMLYRLTQIRKDGLQLYYSAIDEAMIDVTVRRLTFWYWMCQAHTGRFLSRTLWPPDRYRKSGQRPYRREWVRVRPEIAGLYDTLGKVAAPVKALSVGTPERWVKPPDKLTPETVPSVLDEEFHRPGPPPAGPTKEALRRGGRRPRRAEVVHLERVDAVDQGDGDLIA